jgi:peptidoglycan/LPS O-acetylase OafA/YrhL
MKQMKQIYTLRGIGVILIIIFHWLYESQMSIIAKGPVAVDIFFVLSGFFITRILLEGREKSESEGFTKLKVFKFFVLSRALRIFPIYYLTIFFLYVFQHTTDTNIGSNFIYFLTYTSNFYFQDKQSWDGITSHLWSLAVEEQFYLIWPFVVLLPPKKYLPYIFSLFILTGLLTQYFWARTEYDITLPFTCFDALGLGALLSWITMFQQQHLKKAVWATGLLVAGCLAYFFGGKAITGIFPYAPEIFFAAIAGLVISYVVYVENLNKQQFFFILNNRFLIFIGKLCYGIYVYHNILPHYLMKIMDKFQLYSYLPSWVLKYFDIFFYSVNFILLIFVSWLSWKYIEKPILGLKKYFQKESPKNIPFKTVQKSAAA